MISIVMLHADLHPVLTKLAANAVASVRKYTSDSELIIVYNGCKNIGLEADEVVYTKENDIAAAYNAGFARAHGDFFCCLHNDTEVPEGWAEALTQTAGNNNIAFPKISESQSQPALRGFYPTPEWMPPGCCFVISRKLWKGLGGYDEQFKGLHWEDADLFYRAQKAGAKLIRNEDVTILHHKAATRTFLKDKGEAAMEENRSRFLEKHKADGEIIYPKLEGF